MHKASINIKKKMIANYLKEQVIKLNACNLKSTGRARSPTHLQSSLGQAQANTAH